MVSSERRGIVLLLWLRMYKYGDLIRSVMLVQRLLVSFSAP